MAEVAELWRYPVKSLRGESLGEAELVADGVAGDRSIRIVRDGERVSARTVHGLLGLAATMGGDGEPLVDGVRWDDPAALARVTQLAGDGVELIRDPTEDRFDAAQILVTTDGALAELGEDRRRFRPNIVLSGVEGRAEREWVGSRLQLGSAELEVTEPCERCVVTTIHPDTLESDPSVLRRINGELGGIMGVYCRVVTPGRVAVGDDVRAMP